MIFEEEKDRSPALLLIMIYITSTYVHVESQWLMCNMAEVEQCPMVGGSPLSTYVSLHALEHQ